LPACDPTFEDPFPPFEDVLAFAPGASPFRDDFPDEGVDPSDDAPFEVGFD
jgi:hypothetical protein